MESWALSVRSRPVHHARQAQRTQRESHREETERRDREQTRHSQRTHREKATESTPSEQQRKATPQHHDTSTRRVDVEDLQCIAHHPDIATARYLLQRLVRSCHPPPPRTPRPLPPHPPQMQTWRPSRSPVCIGVGCVIFRHRR